MYVSSKKFCYTFGYKMYVVFSKSIANFEFPWVTYIRFSSSFVAFCRYSYPSHIPRNSVILNVQLIFDRYFAWACFLAHFRFLPLPKNGSKDLYQNFRMERSIRNITCKLCAICAKQFARNVRICGSTNIGFCTMIMPLFTHRCLCVIFWPKTTH